jgi:hypothetical protein
MRLRSSSDWRAAAAATGIESHIRISDNSRLVTQAREVIE